MGLEDKAVQYLSLKNELLDSAIDPCLTPLDIIGDFERDPRKMTQESITAYLLEGNAIPFVSMYGLLYSFLIREFSGDTYDSYQMMKVLEGIAAVPHRIKMDKEDRESLDNTPTLEICVVCEQNQGRSQIVEKMINSISSYYGLKVNVVSRGAKATPEKYGGKPSPIIRKKLSEIHQPIDEATVDTFSEQDVNDKTILVILDDSIQLEEWTNNASYILRYGIKDYFPGSRPPNDDDRLAELITEAIHFSFTFVSELAYAITEKDVTLFENAFKNQITYKSGAVILH